jgi:phosphatidylglycerophosphate synthase
MAHTTIAQIVATLPPDKKDDTPWSKFVLRPLSFPAAWIFLALGWGPNAVTYLAAVFCLIGFGFLIAGPLWAVWIGLGFFFLFGILDCADGNVARVRKTASPWGEWVDAFGGYMAYTTILLGAGAASQSMSGGALPGISGSLLPWAGGWTLVGGAAAAANLFMRTIYQSHRAIRPDPGRASVGEEKSISNHLGITGMLLPAFAVGVGFGALPWVLAAYTVFYCGGCCLVSVRLIRRVETEIREARKNTGKAKR